MPGLGRRVLHIVHCEPPVLEKVHVGQVQEFLASLPLNLTNGRAVPHALHVFSVIGFRSVHLGHAHSARLLCEDMKWRYQP